MARSWLDSVEKRTPGDYHIFHRNGQTRSRLFFLTFIVGLIIVFSTFNGPRATSNATRYLTHSITNSVKSTTSSEAQATSTSKHVGTIRHVLSPADKGNADVCKLLLSAVVNKYEPVTLYNFHKTGNKLAKISGGLDYMKELDASHDDELLLIVDGFDEWFQLPASIMEARYHDINRRENERILTRTGHSYKQNIIISTQRQCWPGNGADISCYAAPESPLPAYIFGPETDNMIDDWNRYARLRPRYMNAGYTMGPVKAMRELWTRAQEYADDDPNVVGLDQNILARIWGEQNYVRESTRFTNEPLTTEHPDYSSLPSITGSSSTKEAKDSNISSKKEEQDTLRQKRDLGYPDDKASPARKPFHPRNGTKYEFGIGLDYGSELSLPTVFAEYDADWLTFANASSLSAAFAAQNVTHPGATRLQADIAALPLAPLDLNQYWDHSQQEQKHIPDEARSVESNSNNNKTWHTVPLFTNLWTGITPAIVHHNAWRDGLKDRRETTWQQMWFQSYARELLDAWAAAATSSWSSSHKQPYSAKFRRYWAGSGAVVSSSSSKQGTQGEGRGLGAMTDNAEEGNWVPWRELCDEVAQEEVFRDGRGVWVGLGGKEKQGEVGKGEGEGKKGKGLRVVHNEPV